MKLSDFTMEMQVDEDGTSKLWITGSKSDYRGVGTMGGKKYQVKIHQKPIWRNTSQKISELEAQVRACTDDDVKADFEKQINTLKSQKARNDASDKVADDYVAIKQNLIKELKAIGDPLIVGPAEFWTQAVDLKEKGNAVCTVEAAPWFENVAVWFENDKPLSFTRDFDKTQQYKVIASLAERVAVLHDHGIIHGDLKIGNTLITKEGSEFKAVLIDFDGAIVLKELYADKYKFGAWSFAVGGTYYAPETYEFNRYVKDRDNEDFSDFDLKSVGTASDIFALGVTIYEYLYGRADGKNLLPYVSPSGEKLDIGNYAKAISCGYKLDLPPTMDDFLYGIFNWMLAPKASDRPTAKQVKEAFLTQDLSKAPSWCVRNPLWEVHRDDYKVMDVPGVTLQRAGKDRYLVRRDGTIKSYDIKGLVREKLVEELNPSAPPPPPAPSNKDKVWESDGSGTLPPCVTRASSDGRYLQNTGGVMRGVSYKDIVAAGILCTEAEKFTPWPCDSGLDFSRSAKKIKRDMGYKKGPGYYLVGEGVAAIPYTKQALLEKGIVNMGITFKLHPGDAEIYDTVPEKIPSSVKNVLRSMMNHQYRIIYNDGKEEKLSIADMLSRGYVKKK